MVEENDLFQRAELLMGNQAMTILAKKRIIVFGVGGVGSWCVEALVRTGVGHLTIVDCDRVCTSNINRQLMATTKTVGQVKVEVLKQRMLDINPNVDIQALQQVFSAETADTFDIGSYDYVIDAIDSLKDKALLIEMACMTNARLFSSMGAALKMDPTRIKVDEFWKVKGDPLARALRNHFKKRKTFPKKKFKCVFSDELLKNIGSRDDGQRTANGSLVHITAIFGLTLAALVVKDVADGQ